MDNLSERLIASIYVEQLFGLYTYTLPQNGSLDAAAILYGDNGIGKSTILRLVFHLLSPAPNRGHRSAMFKVMFKKIEVSLLSGVSVSATRANDISENKILFQISEGEKTLASWNFSQGHRSAVHVTGDEVYFSAVPEDFKVMFADAIVQTTGRITRRKTKADIQGVPEGEAVFLETLEKYAPVMFILNAERRLDSDKVPDPSDEMELRRVMRMEEPKRINDLVVRSREIALSQALGSAARWIGRKAVQGTNQGSMNVHAVYLNVLRHLVEHSGDLIKSSDRLETDALVKRLEEIELKTKELSRYELETQLSTSEFRDKLTVSADANIAIASDLLKPYVESLEGRLSALEPLYNIIDMFVNIINNLLNDKTLNFTLSNGFSIMNKIGTRLVPSNLSSGEQQLLLLFCYVLIGRDSSSVFMIDEPEISLNVKWQRRLIRSLLDITKNATIQFVFASHSMELLSQHRKNVVRLENSND